MCFIVDKLAGCRVKLYNSRACQLTLTLRARRRFADNALFDHE
jgi:hypothetical protein